LERKLTWLMDKSDPFFHHLRAFFLLFSRATLIGPAIRFN
jgi:hypothetical protein